MHLLPQDLSFDHGGTKLASCPRRHLTSLRPWSHGPPWPSPCSWWHFFFPLNWVLSCSRFCSSQPSVRETFSRGGREDQLPRWHPAPSRCQGVLGPGGGTRSDCWRNIPDIRSQVQNRRSHKNLQLVKRLRSCSTNCAFALFAERWFSQKIAVICHRSLLEHSHINRYCKAGVSKLRPAGQRRPAKPFHPAREAILLMMKK